MTYQAKTRAEWNFRLSVRFARIGKRCRKNPRRWFFHYDWEDVLDRRQRILRRIHEREMQDEVG